MGDQNVEKGTLSREERELLVSISKSLDGKRFLGFKIQELTVIITIVLGVYSFYLRTDDTVKRLVGVSEYVQGFMENSDNYHSVVLGTQFKQGKPENPNYDLKAIRDVINGKTIPTK